MPTYSPIFDPPVTSEKNRPGDEVIANLASKPGLSGLGGYS